MKKSAIILWSVAALFLVCSIPLFGEGNAGAGVCGVIIAAALAYFAIRKKRESENAEVQQPEQSESVQPPSGDKKTIHVYIEKGGKKYHRDKKCSGMKKPEYVSIEYALKKGYTQCKKCSKLK